MGDKKTVVADLFGNNLRSFTYNYAIEIEGLECVVGHVVRRHYGESRWSPLVGKRRGKVFVDTEPIS